MKPAIRDIFPGVMIFPIITAALLVGTAVWLTQWKKLHDAATASPLIAASPFPGETVMPAPERVALQKVKVKSVAEMERLFHSLDYAWPPAAGKTVPRIAIEAFPADMGRISDARHRKSLFLRSLLPIVLAENEHIRQERAYAIRLLADGVPAADMAERHWLDDRMKRYRIRGSLEHKAVRDQLLQRLDVVPVSLALAQAASESGWGMSRFALEGNNLFGHITANESKGMIPQGRPEGLRLAMRSFPSVRDSVRAYVDNLNSSRVYSELWQIRDRLRHTAESLDPISLAAGLLGYSERGQDYVEDIRTIIHNNRLTTLLRHVDLRSELKLADATELAPLPARRHRGESRNG